MLERSPVILALGSSNGSTNLGDETMWLETARWIRNVWSTSVIQTDGMPGWVPAMAAVKVLPFYMQSFQRYRSVPSSKAEAAFGLLMNLGTFRRGVVMGRRFAEGGDPGNSIEKKWAEAIDRCDALLVSGAGGLTDYYKVHAIAGWLPLIMRAKRLRKPVAMLGQGVGPLLDSGLRSMVSMMIDNCDVFTTRDVASKAEALRLAPNANVHAAPDWALLLRVEEPDKEWAVQFARNHLGGIPFTALSLHHDRHATQSQIKRMIRFFIDCALESIRAGSRVLFVANMTNKNRSDDRVIMNQVRDHLDLSSRSQAVILERPVSARRTSALLGLAERVVCTRYHPLVFALAQGTAAIGVAYDEYYQLKLEGALDWFGEADRAYELSAAPAAGRMVAIMSNDRESRLVRATELRAAVMHPAQAWLEGI